MGREKLRGARAGPRSVAGAELALGRGPELFLVVEKIEGSPSLSPTSRLALWVRAMWDEVPWPSGPGGGIPRPGCLEPGLKEGTQVEWPRGLGKRGLWSQWRDWIGFRRLGRSGGGGGGSV